WRVAILPYVEQEGLYRQFKLDEPWDSPANKPLLGQMPRAVANPGGPPNSDTTRYPVFGGGGAPVQRHNMVGLPGSVPDGTANTILVAETTDAVPWTKPDEVEYDPGRPLPALGPPGESFFILLMADGSVRRLPKTLSEKSLRAAVTANGNDAFGPDW